MVSCTLCNQKIVSDAQKTDLYTYLHCLNCDLFFVHPEEHLSPAKEKKRYDQHQNDPADKRYRDFLSQLFKPLLQKLEPKSVGLDYGAGPGPTLSIMFEEAGHCMDIFDPYYANNPSVFNNTYNFISSTETVEHFYNPGKEFKKIWGLLKPGGYLGIMTLLRPENEPFTDWHYLNDETHVALYSRETFRWLAEKLDAELTFIGERVILLEKHH